MRLRGSSVGLLRILTSNRLTRNGISSRWPWKVILMVARWAGQSHSVTRHEVLSSLCHVQARSPPQLVVRARIAVLMTSNAYAKPRGALARRRALVTTRIAES